MGVISLLTKWLYLEKEKALLALQQEVNFAIWSQLPAESQFSAFPQKVGDWGAFLSFLFFFFQFVILFLNLFFNWKRIALKYCVCFCCPTIQISCNIVISSLEPPFSSPNPPLQVIRKLQAGLLMFYSNFSPATCFTQGCVCMLMLLSLFVPLFSIPYCVHGSVLYIFISIPSPVSKVLMTEFDRTGSQILQKDILRS